MDDKKIQQLEDKLTEEESAMLDQLADKITHRKMTAPALFFFESMKPLGFVSSQMLLFFRPIVEAMWPNPVTYDRITKVLERRGSIELLLRRLEARS